MKNCKFYICESKERFDSEISTAEYEVISIFDVAQFDKKAWLKLMQNKVRVKTDKPLFIYYPEYYLNVVEQKYLVSKLIRLHNRPFSFLTDSPYILSKDSYDKYIEAV